MTEGSDRLADGIPVEVVTGKAALSGAGTSGAAPSPAAK